MRLITCKWAPGPTGYLLPVLCYLFLAPVPARSETPPKRAHHELVYDESSKTIVLSGGSTPLNGGQSFAFYNDVWHYDGKEWRGAGKAGNERSGFRMAYNSSDGKIYSFGGYSGRQSLGDLRVLENGDWKTLADDPEMRAAEPGFVYDSHRNKLIAFGGSGNNGVNNSTREWDGKAWKKFAGTGPDGRQAFAMVYDSKRKRTILFGGMGATPQTIYKDTWEYDGKNWQKVDTAGPQRMSPGYAYDSKRGLLIVFGGMNSAGMLGDTWAWDGKSWQQLSTEGPSKRAMGYLAYDKARDKVVLFGGRPGWPNDVNDTWEWDGKKWTEVSAQDYPGQKPPGKTAAVFAPGLISTDSFEHSAPSFSPDGKRVLWTVMPSQSGKPAFTMEMVRENGGWSTPRKVAFTDSNAYDVYPSFSVDGSTVYFSSNRKLPAGYGAENGNRLWQVALLPTGWGIPSAVDTSLSTGQDYAHSMTADGRFYISGGGYGSGDWNIKFTSKKGGPAAQPEWLPYGINSTGYEDGPFIAPDESYLIFESQRPEGIGGSLDLYISFKDKNGRWRLPQNMGPHINSAYAERFGRVSPDGKYLFFGSSKNQSPANRGFDIFWIDASIIAELKNASAKQPVIDPVAGKKILAALANENWRESEMLLRQWVLLQPNNLMSIIDYGSVLRKVKKYKDAEALLMQKEKLFPGNAALNMEIALVKFAVNKDAEAEALLTTLLAVGEQQWDRLMALSAELLDLEKFAASDNYFQKAMAVYSRGIFYFRRGVRYAELAKNEKAFELLKQAATLGLHDRKTYEEEPALKNLKDDPQWKKLAELLK